MGELMRRYWQPIGAAVDLESKWTKRVRLLGEDLVIFKDRQGRLGLIAEQCPHRRASFAHGIPRKWHPLPLPRLGIQRPRQMHPSAQ